MVSGARMSVLLKASSEEHCTPYNFWYLRLIVYLTVHQMKYVMER